MMKIEQTLKLDMFDGGACPVIRAKQGDASTRFVRVKMTCGEEDYPMPEGASAHFRCLKPDGKSCLNPAVVNEDGTVTVELTDQVLAVPGMVWADVCLLGENGDLLSTLSFQIRVDFAPVGMSASSENEVQTLLELIRQAGMLEGGASAYEIAVKHGFAGSEAEWLASLKGEAGLAGPAGPAGADGADGADGVDGKDGADGADGHTPVRGVDYYTPEDQAQLLEDVMEELPVQVGGDGYTDITGLRRLKSVNMIHAGDYVTIVTGMEGGKTDSTVVVLDENGYPDKIVTGSHECSLSWSGFAGAVPEAWEGGSY